MSRAGRVWAAGAVLLVLALVAACSALALPAAPRTPAPVHPSWPGCAAVGAFTDDPDGERAGVGGIPAGFVASAAVLCDRDERQDAAGDTVSVDLERTATDVAPLLTYLAQPDERPTSGACTADGWIAPSLFLLDANGRYVAPGIPVDGCGKPLGWSRRDREPLAWEALSYTDRVVRHGGVVESAAAKASGCAMSYKDMAARGAAGDPRPAALDGDPWGRGDLRACVFAVSDEGRREQPPYGDFVSGRVLSGDTRAQVGRALADSSAGAVGCTETASRFVVLDRADQVGPTLFVELDGCRDIADLVRLDRVAQASPALVALLGG